MNNMLPILPMIMAILMAIIIVAQAIRGPYCPHHCPRKPKKIGLQDHEIAFSRKLENLKVFAFLPAPLGFSSEVERRDMCPSPSKTATLAVKKQDANEMEGCMDLLKEAWSAYAICYAIGYMLWVRPCIQSNEGHRIVWDAVFYATLIVFSTMRML